MSGPSSEQVPTERPASPASISTEMTSEHRQRLRGVHATPLLGLRARIAVKLVALAAGIAHNHRLGQPTRAFAALAVRPICGIDHLVE